MPGKKEEPSTVERSPKKDSGERAHRRAERLGKELAPGVGRES